jgi:arylsulfatase A-like enzyme
MKHLIPILCGLSVLCGSPAQAAQKPNILIILSDDQGYADAGFQGSNEAVTPHLDALAKSGVRCASGYVTYPVCSPSRAGLLTGRYQARFGHENNPVYDPLDANEGLPLTEKLLPHFLKAAGYRTGWIGKWHLGASPSHVPWQRGFDESFGFIGGGHRFTGWQPHERLLWRMHGRQSFAIREGNWKLVRNANQPPELNDLAADIAESRDLATAQPEVTTRLTATLEA